jgi:hypothetical protein
MLLTSIKGRLTLLVSLVVMIGFLVCLMVFLNYNLQRQIRSVSKFSDTDNLINVLYNNETNMVGDEPAFQLLMADYRNLKQFCTDCHSSRDTILENRIALLQEQHSILLQSSPLRKRINHQLNRMINSVRYIHEYHTTLLRNNMHEGRLQREVVFTNGQFRKHPMQSAAEIDLIDQAVAIQHSLTALYSTFFLLYSPHDAELLLEKFQKELTVFFNVVNIYENSSIDSQDGLLCEELLEGGRFFENSLKQLLRLETHKKLVNSLLDENKNTLAIIFAEVSGKVGENHENSLKYMHITYILSVFFAVIMVLVSFYNFKKIFNSIRFIRREAGKIEKDSRYRIIINDRAMEEERQMATALNNMAEAVDNRISTSESDKNEAYSSI